MQNDNNKRALEKGAEAGDAVSSKIAEVRAGAWTRVPSRQMRHLVMHMAAPRCPTGWLEAR